MERQIVLHGKQPGQRAHQPKAIQPSGQVTRACDFPGETISSRLTRRVVTPTGGGAAAPFTEQGLQLATRSKGILSGLSLGVAAGWKLGLFGPNGAGKSTVFKTFIGILPPSAGVLEKCRKVFVSAASHQV